MITFKLNNQPILIPTSWEEVTYSQYLQIMTIKDDVIQLVAIFTGKDYDYLKGAEILGLDRLLEAISFINTPPQFPGYVDQCGPYKIPANSKGHFNVQYESLGQFEDARAQMRKLDGTIPTLTKVYGSMVAVYLQKIRDGKYDPLKVPELEAEIQSYPAYQVITLGSFFFLKLRSLSTGTIKTSPPIPQNPKKSKRVLKPSKRSSGATRK